jgi:heat shock protein HslJ
MKRSLFIITMSVAFAVAVLGQNERISSRQWKLVELNGANVASLSGAYIELNADETGFTGNAGCNRMFGGVNVRGRRISFANVGSTRMACADRRKQGVEMELLLALAAVDRLQQKGNSLELYAHRRRVIKFIASTKQSYDRTIQSVRLEDKKWTLESIGGTAIAGVGRTAFVVFDKNKGSAGGNTNCNVFGGNYSATDSTLAITDIISTMRACEEGARMEVERQFLDGLQSVNRYEIRDGKLLLYRDKQLRLTLRGEQK